MLNLISGALRLAAVSLAVCGMLYPLAILGMARLLTPESAGGSLLCDVDGKVIGSSRIGQSFTRPEYFHGRPSAVDCNGAISGASNLSSASPLLRRRGEQAVAAYGATPAAPLPADLAAASGSGLDPDISLAAARIQIPRIAAARNLPVGVIGKIVEAQVSYPGGLRLGEPFVNVLQLNLQLDRLP